MTDLRGECLGCRRLEGDLHEHHCRHFNPKLHRHGRRLVAEREANRVTDRHCTPQHQVAA